MKHYFTTRGSSWRKAIGWSKVLQCVGGLFVVTTMNSGVNAQVQPITVATGTSLTFETADYVSQGLPFSYVYYQQIIHESEILSQGGATGVPFSSIRLNFPNIGDVTTYGDWDIWIGTTAKERFQNGGVSDWEPTAGLTKVFSGNIHNLSDKPSNGNWFDIPFNEGEFVYNGGNVVIAIYEKTAGDDGTWSILSSSTIGDYSTPNRTQNRGRLYAAPTNNIDVTSLPPLSFSIDTVFQVQLIQPISVKEWKTSHVQASFDYSSNALLGTKDYMFYQQIIRAEELANGGGQKGMLEKIRIFVESLGSNPSGVADWDIWIGQTSKRRYDFNSAGYSFPLTSLGHSDWATLEGMPKIFSGDIFTDNAVSMKPVAGQWMQIDLPGSGFEWDGESNVVITFHERSAGSSAGWAFRGYTSVNTGNDNAYTQARGRIFATSRTEGHGTGSEDYDYAILPNDYLPPYSFRLDTLMQIQFIGKRIDCNALTITGDNTMCANGTVQLSLSDNSPVELGVWTRTPTTLATVTKGKVKANATAATVTISYQRYGCPTPIDYPIAISSGTIPTVSAVSNQAEMCQDTQLDLNSLYTLTSDETITWISDRPEFVSIDGNGIATAMNRRNGTTKITYIVKNTLTGCSAEGSFTIGNVKESGKVSIVSDGATTLCATGSVTLSATGNVSGHTWHKDNVSTPQVGTGATFSPTESGVYFVKGTKDGCEGIASVTVTITPSVPMPSFPDGSVCAGQTTALQEVTNISGHWENSNNETVTGNVGAGTYTYVADAGECVSGTTTWTVTEKPTVTMPTFTNTSICVDGDISFPSTNGVDGTWSPTTINDQIDGVYTFYPTAGQCGTLQPLDWEVTVNPNVPMPTIASESVCAGQTTALPEVTNISGHWENSNNETVTGNVGAGTYTYVVDAGECVSGTTTWMVTETPNVTTPPFLESAICSGDAISFPSSDPIVGHWEYPVGTTVTEPSNTASRSYVFIPNDECASTAVWQLTVNPILTTPTFDPKTICAGQTATLPNTGNVLGQWENESNDPVNTATVNAAGTYTYKVTAGQCGTPTNETWVVTVNNPVVVEITEGSSGVQVGQTTTFVGTPAGGTWTSSDVDIADFANPNEGVLTAKMAGNVKITYTVNNVAPCTGSVSDEKDVSITSVFSNVNDLDNVSNVSLFPNPATNNVNVYFTLANAENVSFEVVDLNGKVLETIAVNNVVTGTNSTMLNVSNYANGIYTVVLRSNNSLTTQKLVISK